MSTSPPIEESAPAPMTRRRFDTESPWVVNASRLILLIVLFALWEIGGGWLFDTFYFSKPSLIAKAFAHDIVDPAFYTDLATTGLRTRPRLRHRWSFGHRARHPAGALAFRRKNL